MGREACEGQVDSRTGLKNAALYLHVLSVLHGGELRVDIPGVSVGELAYGEGVTAYAKISGRASKRAPIFFCNISELRLRKILRDGDGVRSQPRRSSRACPWPVPADSIF